jgi:hypothetical protein
MLHFLVPCQCGQKLEVTPAQAGQQMTCVCGRGIDVPTLRGLQSLERVGDAAAPAPRRWGARQGLLFLGCAIASLSLIAAAGLEYFHPRELIVVQRLLPAGAADAPALIDVIDYMDNFASLTPADVWLTWEITRAAGPDPRLSRDGAIADRTENHWRSNWRDWIYLVLGSGGIGAVLIAAGLLIPAKRTRPKGRRQARAVS